MEMNQDGSTTFKVGGNISDLMTILMTGIRTNTKLKELLLNSIEAEKIYSETLNKEIKK